MKKVLFLLFALVLHNNLFAQEKRIVIDNQTPGSLSDRLTYPQQRTVEDMTIKGYINKKDMDFINSLIKDYNLKILDLSNVTTVLDGVENCLWGKFLSFGSNKELQKVRLPLATNTAAPQGYSGSVISSMVDTLEIGWEDLSVIGRRIWTVHAKHLILLEKVRIIPDSFFMTAADENSTYNNEWYDGYEVTLPESVTIIGGRAFGRYAQFQSDFSFPDSAEYIGKYPLEYDSYLGNYGHAYINSWCERKPSISDKKFSFPLNLRFYNSLDYEPYMNAPGTKRVFTSDEFKSDTIIVHERCDTLYVKLRAKIAYFYNRKPVVFWTYEDLNIDTLYIPEGCMSAYLEDSYMYEAALKSEPEIHIKAIKEMKSVKTVKLNKNKETCLIGDKINLEATISPVDAFNKALKWTSSDNNIATVNSDGIVNAIKPGTVWVKASSESNPEISDSCMIAVVQPVNGISLNYDKYQIDNIGETIVLLAIITPTNATNKEVRWSSSNENVCIVENGEVTAVSPGTATITATTVDGNYTAKCFIKVVRHVNSIELNKSSLSLKVGENERLTATVRPDDADDATFVWSSTNENIITVDERGVVSALNAGEAWIKAISNDNINVSDSCKVVVLQPVTGVTLDCNTYQLNTIGESFEIHANIEPSNASNKNVRWISSNESVCLVSHGVVVAVGYGSCVIIANTDDGGYIATCSVIVMDGSGITSHKNCNEVVQIYDINGIRLKTLQRGINIVRLFDGTTHKIIVK